MGVSTFPGKPSISVNSYDTSDNVTRYLIELNFQAPEMNSSFVETDLTRGHSVSRRYSEMRTLEKALKKQAGLYIAKPFPRKHFRQLTSKQLEERKNQLDEWLQSVLDSAWTLADHRTGAPSDSSSTHTLAPLD
jgi:hypothetical protein